MAEDTPDEIWRATREMLALIIRINGVRADDLASALFTTTPDLNIAFVGAAKPNTFGGGAYARGIKPEMYAGFESPIPANNNTKKPETKREAKKDRGAKREEKSAAAAPATTPRAPPVHRNSATRLAGSRASPRASTCCTPAPSMASWAAPA